MRRTKMESSCKKLPWELSSGYRLLTLALVLQLVLLTSVALGQEKMHLVACDGEALEFNCPDGEIIKLDWAMYGRLSLKPCNKDGVVDGWEKLCMLSQVQTDVSFKSAIKTLSERCDGKRTCAFNVSVEAFGLDPCPGTAKYVEAEWECKPVEFEPQIYERFGWFLDRLPLGGSPGPPQLLAVHPINSTSIRIDWDSGPAIAGTKIKAYVTLPDGSLLSDQPGRVDSYVYLDSKDPIVVSGLSPDTTYSVRLKAISSQGVSDFSDTQYIRTPEAEEITTTTKHPRKDCFDSRDIFPQPCPDTAATLTMSTTTSATITPNPDGDTGGSREEEGGSLLMCPATEDGYVRWPETKPGHVAEEMCPGDLMGMYTWRCIGPHWAGPGPDFSDCVSRWLSDLGHAVRQGDEDPLSAAQTLQQALVTEEQDLTAGDLKRTANVLLPKLVDSFFNGVDSNDGITKEDIQQFEESLVTTSSELLSNSNSEAWQELSPQDRGRSATALVQAVEDIGFESAKVLDLGASRVTWKDNVVLKVFRLDTRNGHSDLSFPSPADLAMASPDWESGSDSITIPSASLKVAGREGPLGVVFSSFKNLEELMQPKPSKSSSTMSQPSSAALKSSSPFNEEDDSHSLNNWAPKRRRSVRDIVDSDDTEGNGAGPHPSLQEPVVVVNSRLIAAAMDTGIRSHDKLKHILPEPVQFTLTHLEPLDRGITLCSFWDMSESPHSGKWSQDGCRAIHRNRSHTVCECDHMTNFAVLMDVNGVELTEDHELALRIITFIGCIISIVCLLLAWVTFTVFKNLQCDRNTIHKNLVLTLLLAESLFVGGIAQTQPKLLCALVAGGLHFLFLSAFAWMCLEGIQLYVMLIEVFEQEKSRVTSYYLFGYGVPFVIVAVSAAVFHQGYGTHRHCWLTTDRYFILSFVGPALAVMLINVAMLSIAIYTMCRHSNLSATMKERSKVTKFKAWLKGAVVLVVLLGLTWAVGLLYLNQQTVVFAYTFTVLNSLQGLFIFFFHCLKNEKVQKEYRKVARHTPWLPDCIRVNYGGHTGRPSSSRQNSTGSGNYLSKLFGGRRKRAEISTNSSAKPFLSSDQPGGKSYGENRSSRLSSSRDSTSGALLPQASPIPASLNGYVYNPSYAHLNNGYPMTAGNGVVIVAPHANSACPQQHHHHLAPCYEEVVGELSQALECSVVDSEMVTEYCQNNLQVSQEKQRYSTGSEDSARNLPPLTHHLPPYLDTDNLSTASLVSSHGHAPSPMHHLASHHQRPGHEEPVYEEVKSENGEDTTSSTGAVSSSPAVGGLNLRQYIISNSRNGWSPSDGTADDGSRLETSSSRHKTRGSLSSGGGTDTASPEKSSSSPDLQFLPGFTSMPCTAVNGHVGASDGSCGAAVDQDEERKDCYREDLKVRSPRISLTQETQHSLPDLPPAGLAPVPGSLRVRYIDPSDPACLRQYRHASETDVQLVNGSSFASDC